MGQYTHREIERREFKQAAVLVLPWWCQPMHDLFVPHSRSAWHLVLRTFRSQEKARTVREITSTVLARAPKMCNFVEWRDKKIVYKR